MREINLDMLKPGMTLGLDAVHRNGRALVTAGTTLTERHLRVLRAWGAYSVTIREPAPETQASTAVEDATPAGSSDRASAIAARFAHADLSHPVIAELFRYRLQRSR